MIDLHVHTSCSDGALGPGEVVRYAAGRGLRALAITDHDTIDGNEAAGAVGREVGIPVIAGVEISTEWDGLTFHLLGYGIHRVTERVATAFQFLRESRNQRNPRMIQRLREQGIDISMEEVGRAAGSEVVGRPHFAQVLLEKGVVGSMQEAFDRFLGRNASAYVDKARLDPAQAFQVIHEAGGVAVLAHPGLIEPDRPGVLPSLLEELVRLGLDGIEAYYSQHSPMQTRRYHRLAAERKLLVTGGSDFHRPEGGGPQLGTGFGGLRVPQACFDALQERIARPG